MYGVRRSVLLLVIFIVGAVTGNLIDSGVLMSIIFPAIMVWLMSFDEAQWERKMNKWGFG